MACKLPYKNAEQNGRHFLVQYGVIENIDSDVILHADLFNQAVSLLQKDMSTAYNTSGVPFLNDNMKLVANKSVLKEIDDVRKSMGLYESQEPYVNDTEGVTVTVTPFVDPDIKSGVAELFESNPELANIGAQEQYSQYLDTIFPDYINNFAYEAVEEFLVANKIIDRKC